MGHKKQKLENEHKNLAGWHFYMHYTRFLKFWGSIFPSVSSPWKATFHGLQNRLIWLHVIFFFMGIPQIHCLYWSPTDLTSSKGQHSPSHRRHRPTRQYARKSWGKLQETGSSVYWQWGPSLGRYHFQDCLIDNVIECKMRCKTNYNNISTILFFIHLSNQQVSVPHPVQQ